MTESKNETDIRERERERGGRERYKQTEWISTYQKQQILNM